MKVMKSINYKNPDKILVSILLTLVLILGCNGPNFQELDLNPQSVNQIDLNFMFTPIPMQLSSGASNRAMNANNNLRFCGSVIQHTASFNRSEPGDKYLHQINTTNVLFNVAYRTLQNISEIIRQTGPGGYDEGRKHNLRQVTRILKAFLFHRITDHYGNVPYFEAGQATANDPIFFPKYDSQDVIYADLLRELEEASAKLDINAPDEDFGAADIVYHGDVSKWRKLGNSILLRLAMRISNVAPSLAEHYIASALSGGVITGNEDNFVVPHDHGPNQWVNQNGLSRSANPDDGRGHTYLSKTLIDFLKGNDANTVTDDDPRLMIISGGIAEWPVSDQWILYPGGDEPLNQKGMPNGFDTDGLSAYEGFPVVENATYSRINPKFFQNDEPYMLLHAAEVAFNLAEAAERSLGGVTDAKGHYEAGVKLAMQMYTLYDPSFVVTDEQVSKYLVTYPYGSRDPLEMIGEQLWVSLFLNWMEAFNAWRRTGFPLLEPTNYPGNVTGGTIPQRIRYPESEVAGNPNFHDGSTQPDEYTTRVWWAGGE